MKAECSVCKEVSESCILIEESGEKVCKIPSSCFNYLMTRVFDVQINEGNGVDEDAAALRKDE